MRSGRPRRLSYANVTSTIALVLALSAGTAYAANEWTGRNIVDGSLTGADVRGQGGTSSRAAVNGSITSQDISGQQANPANGTQFVDGTITSYDIKDGSLLPGDFPPNSIGGDRLLNGSVGAVDLAPNSVNSSKVADGSLTGLDVDDNTLTGADVNESTLGDVPSALVGGTGRAGIQGGPCNPNHVDGMPNVCVSAGMALPGKARVLLIATVRGVAAAGSSAEGFCFLGYSINGGSFIYWLDSKRDIAVSAGQSEDMSLFAVTSALNPGPISYGVACSETGSGDIHYVESQIAAVALSPN
jgi:hypothetical protein